MPRKTAQDAPGRKKTTKSSRDKATRKRLEKQLDSLWAQIAHSKAKNCQWPSCINTERLTAHHFFHKAQGLHARWDLRNVVVLCYAHHIFQVHTKGDTEPIRDIMIRNLGIDDFEHLKWSVRQVWKPTLDELTDLKDEFVAILDECILRDTGI